MGGLLLYECWLLVSILIEVHYVFSTQQQPAPLIFLSQKKSFLLSIINLIILFFMVLQKMVLKINHFSSGKLIIKAQWALSLIRKRPFITLNKGSIFLKSCFERIRDLSLIPLMLKFKNEKKLQDGHFFSRFHYSP